MSIGTVWRRIGDNKTVKVKKKYEMVIDQRFNNILHTWALTSKQ